MKPSSQDSALIASFIASRGVTRVESGVATMTREQVAARVHGFDTPSASAEQVELDMERRNRALSATFRGTYAGRKFYR